MRRWVPWEADVTYPAGAYVKHGAAIWKATRTVTGAEPGASTAWVAAVLIEQSGTDKATMAQTIDERIGRGH